MAPVRAVLPSSKQAATLSHTLMLNSLTLPSRLVMSFWMLMIVVLSLVRKLLSPRYCSVTLLMALVNAGLPSSKQAATLSHTLMLNSLTLPSRLVMSFWMLMIVVLSLVRKLLSPRYCSVTLVMASVIALSPPIHLATLSQTLTLKSFSLFSKFVTFV